MRRREFVAAIATLLFGASAHGEKHTLPEIGLLSSRSPNESASLMLQSRMGSKKAAMSRGRTLRFNTDGRMVTMIGCQRWPPIS